MENLCVLVFLLLATSFAVLCKPVDTVVEERRNDVSQSGAHNIAKRFINPFLTSGGFDDTGLTAKMRTKRSTEDCEKLQLCKLHARSNRSFFAAFELYFVNKENARLWDHQARSIAECNHRYSCYDR